MSLTSISSFGFKQHPLPEQLAYPKSLVIDVRTRLNRNPYHKKELRKLRGTDQAVQDELRLTPGFEESYQQLKAIVAAHDGPVFLGCTGGHHRSVFLAELLGKELGVPVTHYHIHTGRTS